MQVLQETETLFTGFIRQNTLANAYLLTGASSIARENAAQFFAQILMCNEPNTSFCGTCPQCKAFQEQEHIDFIQIIPDTTIKIEHIRSLQDQIKYGPTKSKRLVVCIHNAESLTDQAANACLKTLEEPPKNVHFLLLAPSSKSVLATIYSRCQECRIPSLDQDQLSLYTSTLDDEQKESLSKFPSISLSLKSQLLEILKDTPSITPTGFGDFLKLDPIQHLQLAQDWASNRHITCFYLAYWLEELWLKKNQDMPILETQELIIDNIKEMQYNVNLKLQLEALFLSIRSLWNIRI